MILVVKDILGNRVYVICKTPWSRVDQILQPLLSGIHLSEFHDMPEIHIHKFCQRMVLYISHCRLCGVYLFCCQTHLGSCEGVAVEHSGTRPSLTGFVLNRTRWQQSCCLVRTPAHWKRQNHFTHMCEVRNNYWMYCSLLSTEIW